jgi:ribonuclease D
MLPGQGKIEKLDMKVKYQIIDTAAGLKDIAKYILREQKIGVDLEADSMYHYQEKVCLLQVATRKINIIIDPLKIRDLAVLKPIFSKQRIQKIFHGADYDVRSLYRDFNIDINNLFDTQLAAMFLGLKETGLDAVIKQQFNVTLEKKYQRKDWSKRPLPPEMIAYAAADVRYLIPLAEIFADKLANNGRLQWVKEECRYLSNVRPVQNDKTPLFLNFKGAGRLSPICLTVLEALLQYRKKIALQKDRPVFKILRNQVLMTLAFQIPTDKKSLEKSKALSRKQLSMYGDGLLATINRALKTSPEEMPVYPRQTAPIMNPAVPRRLRALRAWRDAKAKTLEIDPAMLFNKTLLGTIAAENPRNMKTLGGIAGIKNWQKNEFGREIINVLAKG